MRCVIGFILREFCSPVDPGRFIARFPNNKSILAAYAELRLEYLRRTGSYNFFDVAMDELKAAEARCGDADVTTMIGRFERRATGSEANL